MHLSVVSDSSKCKNLCWERSVKSPGFGILSAAAGQCGTLKIPERQVNINACMFRAQWAQTFWIV